MADLNQAYQQLRGVWKDQRPGLVRQLGLTSEDLGQIEAMARSDSSLGFVDRSQFFPWAGSAGKEMRAGPTSKEPSVGDMVGSGLGQAGGFMGAPFRAAQDMAQRSNPNATQGENDAWKFGWNLLATPANLYDAYQNNIGVPFQQNIANPAFDAVGSGLAAGLGGVADAANATGKYLSDYVTLPSRDFQAQRGGQAAPPAGNAAAGAAMADAGAKNNPMLAALSAFTHDQFPGLSAGGGKQTINLGSPGATPVIPARPDPLNPAGQASALQSLAGAGQPQYLPPTEIPPPPQMGMPVGVDTSSVSKWLAEAAPKPVDEGKIEAATNEQLLEGALGGIAQGWFQNQSPLGVLMGALGGAVSGRRHGQEEGKVERNRFEEDRRAYARLMASSGLDIAQINASTQNARNQTDYTNRANSYNTQVSNIQGIDRAKRDYASDMQVWQQNAAKIGVDAATLDYNHRQAVAENGYNNLLIDMDNKQKALSASAPEFRFTDGGMLIVTKTQIGPDGKPQRVAEISDPGLVAKLQFGQTGSKGLGALSKESEFQGATQAFSATDPLAIPYFLVGQLESKGLLPDVFGSVLDDKKYQQGSEDAMMATVGAGQKASEEAAAKARWGMLATLLSQPDSPFLSKALSRLGYDGAPTSPATPQAAPVTAGNKLQPPVIGRSVQ